MAGMSTTDSLPLRFSHTPLNPAEILPCASAVKLSPMCQQAEGATPAFRQAN